MKAKMQRFGWVVLALVLTACSTASAGSNMNAPAVTRPVDLPDLGPAPELSNSVWLNTDSPLRLADLRGKVVGVEMWTFGCINCQHVIPSLKSWYAQYKDQGFVLIGNHYPEFGSERDLGSLKQAVARAGIEYPVAQDNDGATWSAYHNGYWPTLYLIDKRGRIRYVHIGEGAYAETEANIKGLLAETYP
jgi:thiol-disulfide isomerase/thioredoxin